MIEPVALGGKYWAHNGECSRFATPPHVHYGENVVVELGSNIVPESVLDKYYILFGNPDAEPPRGLMNPDVMETTDAPPYQTTALIPKPRKRKPKKRPKPPTT